MLFFDERIYEQMNKDSADRLWTLREEEYNALYAEVSHKLSASFRDEYEKKYFHDYKIISILPVVNSDYSYNVHLRLSHHGENFIVIYKNVKSFISSISLDDSIFMFDFLQSEILPADNGCISHEFTVAGSNYSFVHIVCEGISLEAI